MIGFVLETGFPNTTIDTNCCCIIKIIDDTHHDINMTVNIFVENTRRLPIVAAIGNIIQICSVVVKKHNEEVNVVLNKRFFSFALYNDKNGDVLKLYHVSFQFNLKKKIRCS